MLLADELYRHVMYMKLDALKAALVQTLVDRSSDKMIPLKVACCCFPLAATSASTQCHRIGTVSNIYL